MVITTTAVAFILSSIGLAFFGWRFLKAFRKTSDSEGGSKVGLLLSLFFIGFTIQTGVILGIGSILLSQYQNGLHLLLVIANSFLTIIALLGAYTTFYIFFPKKSPLFLMATTLILGIVAAVLSIINPTTPFITAKGGIDWNVAPPLSLIMFCLLLIGIGSQLYIFTNLFFQAKTRELKNTSLIISVMALGGIVGQFFRFIVFQGNSNPTFRTNVYDFTTGAVGLIFIVGLIILSFSKRKDSVVK